MVMGNVETNQTQTVSIWRSRKIWILLFFASMSIASILIVLRTPTSSTHPPESRVKKSPVASPRESPTDSPDGHSNQSPFQLVVDRQNKLQTRSNSKSKTLLVFLHFHKAGGTSIVNAARKRHNLFEPNNNGNPKQYERNKKSKIPFWTYSGEKLVNFIARCLNENGATFIAAENSWFQNVSIINEEFKRQNRIELVTQFRNPFARFVSNYFFDLKTRRIREPVKVMSLPLIERLRLYHLCGATEPTGNAGYCRSTKFKFNAVRFFKRSF